MPKNSTSNVRATAVPGLPEPPDVFSYVDYRGWLRVAVQSAAEHDRYWTHRRLAALCGFRSSGGLSLVTGGHRRLSEAAARRIGHAFGLRPAEIEHLALCVRYEQAESASQKTVVLRRMRQQRRFVQSWEGTLRTLSFYETWYLPVLRECVSLLGEQATARAIADRLRPDLSESEVTAGLQRLVELGFLSVRPDGGWTVLDPILATDDEVASTALRLHHEQMIARATAGLDVPAELRNFRTATVTVSREQARQIHQMVHRFVREVMATVAEDGPLEEVYQLNLQWYPWTNPTELPDKEAADASSTESPPADTPEPQR